MYKVFDDFITINTWHTSNPLDDQRFYKSLSQVVWSNEFSPDEMGRYFEVKLNRSLEEIDSSENGMYFTSRIGELVTKAWGVKDFLQYTGISNR